MEQRQLHFVAEPLNGRDARNQDSNGDGKHRDGTECGRAAGLSASGSARRSGQPSPFSRPLPRRSCGGAGPPLPATPSHAVRYDYEYKRNGTASVFMFTEPLGGWRKVNVRKQRTKIDWATEIRALLEIDYPDAEKVFLVCDNLNTHTLGALYAAFKPEEAFLLLKRLEIHYTPKHGSWLNIAEIDLSALTRQYLDRRIKNLEILKCETKSGNRIVTKTKSLWIGNSRRQMRE